MKTLLDKISGYKTYGIIALGLLVTLGYWLNLIPSDLYKDLLILLGLGGAATMRAAIS